MLGGVNNSINYVLIFLHLPAGPILQPAAKTPNAGAYLLAIKEELFLVERILLKHHLKRVRIIWPSLIDLNLVFPAFIIT